MKTFTAIHVAISLAAILSGFVVLFGMLTAQRLAGQLFRLTTRNTRKENIMSGTLDSTVKTIVLVHGGFVDGSGFQQKNENDGELPKSERGGSSQEVMSGPQGLLSRIQMIP